MGLTFERTFDFDLVRWIITHKRVYAGVKDDFSPAPSDYPVATHPGIWYVLVKEKTKLLGMFVFIPENAICWEVHTCLLPEGRGSKAIEAARGVADWIWANTTCQRIVTKIPQSNKLANLLAVNAGMSTYGVNPRSIQRGGRLEHQYLLGLSRPEEVK